MQRLLRVVAIVVGVVVVLLVLGPLVLSTGFVRGKVEGKLSESLGVPVHVGDLVVSWFSGVALDDLVVDNPPGFPPDEKVLRVRRIHGGVSLMALLRGRVDADATIEGLDVHAFQRADGQTNLAVLAGGPARTESTPPTRPDPESPTEPDYPKGIERVRGSFKLIDGVIEIAHETHGVLELLQDINAGIVKEYGSSDVQVQIDASMPRGAGRAPGHVGISVAADATLQKPLLATFDLAELDLERYRPLLAAFLPADRLTAFAGVVAGKTEAVVDLHKKSIRVSGDLGVANPHFAGPLLQGMNIAAPRWSFAPNVSVTMVEGGAPPLIEAGKLRVDLGFLHVEGLSAELANDLNGGKPSLGIGFKVDVGALLGMGGPIPPELSGATGQVEGQLAIVVTPQAFDPKVLAARFTELLGARADLTLDRVVYDGYEFTGLSGKLGLRDGKAHLDAGAMLSGGPLSLALDFDPSKPAEWPGELKLAWKQGQMQAQSVKLLRYAVPMLAGLDPATGSVDVQGNVDCEVAFRGPLLANNFESALAWLNAWSGGGSLDIKQGSLTPAGALQPLLQLAGESGKLAFSDLNTKFAMANGFVETSMLKLSRAAGDIGIRGRAGLDGKIDYAIDLSQLLAQHKDGQRILAAFGGKLPEAKLAGSFDQPTLAMPDISAALQGAAQNAIQGAADQLLKKGLDGLLKKKR